MADSAQARDEDHYRQVEAAMLYVEDAARRVGKAAVALRKDGASPHLIAALETAAGALRADHNRLMKSVYWPAPDRGQEELLPPEEERQQRLAS